MYRVLWVEDDPASQAALARWLAPECEVLGASSLAEARSLLTSARFDLILLDIVLPDGEGFKLCGFLQANEELREIPVVFVTGRFETSDKVLAFALGADDYVTKPVDPGEFRARIMAKLARTSRSRDRDFAAGNLAFSLLSQRAYLNGDGETSELALSPIEFRLLVYLAKHADEVLSRPRIMKAVWGTHVHVLARTVDAHVSALRRKLAQSGARIESVPGEGYRFLPARTTTQAA